MNRTQKEAWFNVAAAVLCIPIIAWALARLFILKRIPEGFERFWPLPVFIIFIVTSIVVMRRKQSPTEVESDERDNLIKYRAVVACFVSVWILLAAATGIPQLAVGVKGSIPVWLLAFINVGVLLIALLVYSAAVLIQYGRGQKGEKS
ncbi:MAG TPA: hypothetical protein VMW16_11955 [Sedimentisphaerales bacterium]|nr:hypothetical protein [Sedimentisphaerales bacterium]